jgi:hypothetical protein
MITGRIVWFAKTGQLQFAILERLLQRILFAMKFSEAFTFTSH